MKFHSEVLVYLKDGILDTQGKAVAKSLTRLGYNEPSVRVGKYIQIDLEASSEVEARKDIEAMCKDLLVNDIIEDYSAKVEEV